MREGAMTEQKTNLLVAHLRVAEAFDGISERFDHDLENEITRRLRARIYDTIETLLKPGSSILDINCGTGIDAINLRRRGFRVAGIDLSPMMIEQAVAKIQRDENLDVHFLTGSFDRVSELAKGPFDLVLSNFGGLNCTDQLPSVAEQVARVLSPSGFFMGGGHASFLALGEPVVCISGRMEGLVPKIAAANVRDGFSRQDVCGALSLAFRLHRGL